MFWKKQKADAAPADHSAVVAALRGEEVLTVNARLALDPQSKTLEVEKSPEEKRFLLKLDLFLLTYGCLSQVIKYLVSIVRDCSDARQDQTNINTAYVSGMSEALNFHGNELNYFATWFNVGCKSLWLTRKWLITRLYLPHPIAGIHHLLPPIMVAARSGTYLGYPYRLHCGVQVC